MKSRKRSVDLNTSIARARMLLVAALTACLGNGCASISLLPKTAADVDFNAVEGKVGWSSYQEGAFFPGTTKEQVYSAAKAGIASFTTVAAAELGRYGVLANGIAPAARSRMTEEAFAEMMRKPEFGFDAMDPANVSPLVVWLGSGACNVSGRMFETEGGKISVADGWQHGAAFDKGARWKPDEIGSIISDLVNSGPSPAPVYGA